MASENEGKRETMNAYEQMKDALVAMVEAETDGTMARDALCGRCLERLFDRCKHDGKCWVDKVINALAAPPRQCDVGTAEEQMEKFREFCQAEKCWRYRCRSGCKATCIDRCALAWAQTPYEAQEGENNG